jgi:hypothetical protein
MARGDADIGGYMRDVEETERAYNSEVARLEAENARLRELVKEAYSEGYNDGDADGEVKWTEIREYYIGLRDGWASSRARAALERKEGG